MKLMVADYQKSFVIKILQQGLLANILVFPDLYLYVKQWSSTR